MDFAQIVLSPFVWLLLQFYNLFNSYGIALILFAIVVKIILFYPSIKGKRGMIQMNMVSEKMRELQKQFSHDKQRYNEEVQKLYAKENINPMNGCLWTFLPLIVLFPLYYIIREPLKFMMSMSKEQIFKVADALNWSQIALQNGWIKDIADGYVNKGYNQLHLASLITQDTLPVVKAAAGEGANAIAINFHFIGINLSNTPQLKFWESPEPMAAFGLFMLPVVSALTGFLFSRISLKTNAVNSQSSQANATSKMMMFVSPVMSLWIGFIMPAGLCVYWIINNLMSMVQEIIAGRILKKDYEKAAILKEQREREAREEEKRRKQEKFEERARRIEEEKKNRGKKKKPAAHKPTEKLPEDGPSDSGAGQVGMRKYARGRAYDSNRFNSDGSSKAEETPALPTDTDLGAPAELEKQVELIEPDVEETETEESDN